MADSPTLSTNVSDLNGLFKRVYADKLKNLIPDNAVLIKRVPFQAKKRLGDTYEQPVILERENGVTYAAAGAGAFALNAPINMATQNARVPSVQMLLRSQMDYEAASKASGGNDAKAFFNSTKLLVQSMLESMTHRLECSMLYGNSSTGLGYSTSTTNTDTTHTVILLTAASWGIGIWCGAEGAQLDAYDTVGGTLGTNINTGGPLTIDSVDVDTRKITVSGDTVSIAALDAVNTNGSDVALYWYGSSLAASGSTNKDMNGIDKIITNTGSLFGISAASYNLWKGATYSVGGAITIAKLLKSTTTAVGKGLNEEVDVYIAPQIFAVLNAEFAGYRQLDSSYSTDKNSNGSTKLTVFAQNGLMNIRPHAMVKAGEGFIIPTKYVCRLGSTDVTFDQFGESGKFFRNLNDNAGYEIRCYSDQAIFIEKPATCTKLTGITY